MRTDRITPRIALASAILGVFAGIVLGALNLYTDYQSRTQAAAENTDRLLRATLPILESAYWEVDVARVEAILSGLLEDPLIDNTWIEDPILTENQRVSAGLSDLRAAIARPETIPRWIEWTGIGISSQQIVKNSMKSPRDGAQFGELVAQLSFVPIINELVDSALVVLSLSMLQTLFVTAAIFVLMQLVVIRPLTRLQQAALDARNGHGFRLPQSAQRMLDRSRQDEISRLARAFQRTFNALDESRQTLQQNVDDRTAELKLARNEAIAASKAKSQFLANMNHELRTPLNAIKGLSVVLDKQELPQTARPLLNDIMSAAEQLAGNIDSVLDLSKIEAGEMEMNPEWFSIATLAQSIASQTRALLIDREPEFTTDFQFDDQLEIFADQNRMRQVVMNFASNAVKFTEKGSIGLDITSQKLSSENLIQLTFSVSDTGPGIPSDKLHDVFRPFGQLDESRSRTHEGTGLGMSIAQHLATALDGEISVDSTVGKGSTFTFTLSAKWRQKDTATASPSRVLTKATEKHRVELQGADILVVEDNRINLSVFVALLEEAGAVVRTAVDGFAAIEQISKSFPQAILMDLHMPVADGFETLKIMQSSFGLAIPPVVATSADATTSQKKNCSAAGFYEFIPKPVDADILIDVISQAVATGSLIDRAAGLRYAGGSVKLFDASLSRFSDQLLRWKDDLKTSNSEAVGELLHVIKGTAATVGARQLESCVKKIELENETLERLFPHIEDLKSYFETFPAKPLKALEQKDIEHLFVLIDARNPSAADYLSNFDGGSKPMEDLRSNLSKLKFNEAKENLEALRQSL